MPEYLHPGVYIEEIERGPRPIEGVPTSTAAFLGEAERGPTTPRLVTSLQGVPALVRQRVRPRQVPALCGERVLRERRQARLHLRVSSASTRSPAQGGLRRFPQSRPPAPGSWGNAGVRVEDSTDSRNRRTANWMPVGFRIALAYWSSATPRRSTRSYRTIG